MKEEEPTDKHEKYDSTNDDIEIPPSFVDSTIAASYPRSRNFARIELRIAFILVTGKEAPSNYAIIRIC